MNNPFKYLRSPLLGVILSAMILGSCTQRRYSHLTFRHHSNSGKQTSIVQTTKKKITTQDQVSENQKKEAESPVNPEEQFVLSQTAVPLVAEGGFDRIETEPADGKAFKARSIQAKFGLALLPESAPEPVAAPAVRRIVQKVRPVQASAPDETIKGLLYIIIVLLLVLIILGLLKAILGPVLWGLLSLAALIFVLGLLLGWW